MNPRVILAYVIGGVTAAVIGAILGWQVYQNNAPGSSQNQAAVLKQARPLELKGLQQHSGDSFDHAALKGHWSLMFMGFTHCPDICPSTLQELKLATEQLRATGSTVPTVYLFSVDPERDSTETLAKYVTSFDANFVGVRGDAASTKSFTQSIGAVYMRADLPASSEPVEGESVQANYTINHTAAIFVINPTGELQGYINGPHTANQLVSEFKHIVEQSQ